MKFINIIFSSIIIVIGIWPFFSSGFPQLGFLPTEGDFYYGIVAAMGVIMLIYNLRSRQTRSKLR